MRTRSDERGGIAVECHDGLGIISLNRPQKRNALNREMCIVLRQTVQELDADETVRVMLVRANGPVFCAGADLSERKTMSEDDVRARRLLAFAAYDAMESTAKPCIAVVEGPAVGAGAEIAAACDFIVATEGASFRYPEVGWGTIGATQRLPELIGRRHAKELLFTGRAVGAAEARELGLISRLVTADTLQAALDEMTAAIIAAPAGGLAATKRCVDERALMAKRAALATEMIAIEHLLAGNSWKDRVKTFGEAN